MCRFFPGLLMGVLLLFAGCTTRVQKSIASYYSVASQIQLGQSKDYVLSILGPTQSNLSQKERKASEQFTKDNKHVEIYFFRSHVHYDGLLTDDEFTPYVFHDGVLAAIGWTALGGPKTQGQLRPEQHITVIR